MRKLIFIVVLSLTASSVFAHEFWLQPAKFIWHKGDTATIDLMVGEDYSGSNVTMVKQRILKLDHYFSDTHQDLKVKFAKDRITNFDSKLNTAGTHLFSFNSNNKFIELEAGKFNDYLRSEGLFQIARLREVNGDTLRKGREVYQRCVKTLLQVDSVFDQTYAINTGMRLEIIPDTNPYAITEPSLVTYKILFDNHPLKNALVLVWLDLGGKATHTSKQTNSEGEVAFPLVKKGRWMISVVHMIPFEDKAIADWQSFWGSYTFGFK